MSRILRKLSFILAFVLVVCQMGSATVLADELDNRAGQKPKELTSIEIINVDEPVPGKPLDTSATVTSAEGESWEIPIVWIEESGKKATIAEAGKKYYPSFVMYVPSQYKIKGMDASGKFPVKLPAFITALYGTDNIYFVVDSASQLIYIVGGPGSVAGGSSASLGMSSNNKSDKIPDSKSDGSSESDDDDNNDDQPDEQSLVERYCAPSAINQWKENEGFLEWLIDVIINEIQPQAVSLLKEGFPAYAEGEGNHALSSDLGLYIYHNEGEIDGEATPAGNVLAFVQGSYNDNNEVRLVMGVNTSTFKLKQDETGRWVLDDDTRDTFDNTIVHEMMHGFMYDYTRTGLMGFTYVNHDYGFPRWFVEGTATAVENVYQYREEDLVQLMKNGAYTAESVKNAYVTVMDEKRQDLALFDIGNSDKDGKDGFDYQVSAYTSGYLACVYLGYLDAISRGEQAERDDGSYDINVIRSGINDILGRLHGEGDGSGCETLSEIVNKISESTFTDTQDFQKEFIKGDEDSNEFVAKYLQMLEDIETTDEKRANGSVLLGNDGQNTNTPIHRGEEIGDPSIYRIIDESGSAVSDVDDCRANTTGGNTKKGTGGHDYIPNQQELAAAAKPEDTADTSTAEETCTDVNAPAAPAADTAQATPVNSENPAVAISDAPATISTAPAQTVAPAANTVAPAAPAANTVVPAVSTTDTAAPVAPATNTGAPAATAQPATTGVPVIVSTPVATEVPATTADAPVTP